MNFTHSILAADRPDLLTKAVDSLRDTPLWPHARIWDNSPGGWVSASRQWPLPVARPVVPLSWAQSMNAFQRDAIENGLDCWSYQHADALLMPGEAEKFVRTVQNATGRWATVFTFYDLVSAYNPVAVAEVGEWDWYFPSADYNVDQDWFRRAKLAGFDLLESHAKVVHLDGGSTTINANPVRLAIHKAKESANRDYYRAKWGGDPGEEKYRTPWNLLE